MTGSPRPTALPLGHGTVALPAFLPDATRGAVRTLDAADLRACGVELLIVNAFHLQRSPGIAVIEAIGGIHAFMGWTGPVLSDSGGFQVLSLLEADPKAGSVTRKGFTYRSAKTGDRKLFTPEKTVRKQLDLGTDVVVCLDHCTRAEAPAPEQRTSVENTVRWAAAGRAEFDRHAGRKDPKPLLFAFVQGGRDPALRRECAERLREIGFDGYGFGGWPIRDDGELEEAVHQVAELAPPEAIRWAAGIGKPEHVVRAVSWGYDLLDCTLPTRDARRGRLYVLLRPPSAAVGDRDFYECLYMNDARHVRDRTPVDPGCDCPCCTTVSRAYLHHLFHVKETLAWRLASLHNLRFHARLLAALRAREAPAPEAGAP